MGDHEPNEAVKRYVAALIIIMVVVYVLMRLVTGV